MAISCKWNDYKKNHFRYRHCRYNRDHYSPPMIPIASMASWDVGTVSVTSKVVTGGAAGFCSTGTGIVGGPTGTTTGGAAPAARSCAGSILVQASADVAAVGVLMVVVTDYGHHTKAKSLIIYIFGPNSNPNPK